MQQGSQRRDPEGWTAEGVGWDGCAMVADQAVKEEGDGGSELGLDAAAVKGKAGRKPRTTVPCQIEGCGTELVGEKGYYRRYRICRQHCVTPVLLVEGREMRFCRPCGRLHSIKAFDGPYGSCRRKLKMNSDRRRKAPEASGSDPSKSRETLCTSGSGGSTGAEAAVGNGSTDRKESKSPGSSSPAQAASTDGEQGADPQQQQQQQQGPRPELPIAPLSVPADPSGVLRGRATAGACVDPAEGLVTDEPDDGGGSTADEEPPLVLDVDDATFLGILMQELQGQAVAASQRVAPTQDVVAGSSSSAYPQLLPELQLPHALLPQHQVALHAMPYCSETSVMRLSMKIFNCTPDKLLPQVRLELERMLGSGPLLLDGFIRPGCLHLITNILMTSSQREAFCDLDNLKAWLGLLTGTSLFVDQPIVMIQASNLVGCLPSRQLPLQPQFFEASLPSFAAVLPLCTLPGGGRHALQGVDMLGLPGTQLHCRQQGRNLTMELLDRGGGQGPCRCQEATRSELHLDQGGHCCPAVHVCGLALGFADMEVQLGRVMSTPRAILVLPDPQAVLEVRTLELSSAGIPDVDAFLRNTGLVVQFLYRHQIPGGERFEPLYRPELLRRLEAMAQEVVVAALARGWPALSRLLLPATTAGGSSASAALSCMDALCPSSSLVDLAASTGSDESLAALVEWASAEGVDVGVAAKAAGPSHSAEPLAEEASKPGALQQAVHGAGAAETRAEFVADFHRQQLWREMWHEVFVLVTFCTLLFKIWTADGRIDPRHFLAILVANVGPGIAIVLLAYRRSPWFIRWRSYLIVLTRLARSVAIVAHSNLYSRDLVHSLTLPASPGSLAFHLLRIPLLTLMGGFGHALPFLANTVSAICYALPYLHYLIGRCESECGVPGQGERYAGLVTAVERAHGAAWFGSAGGLPSSDEQGACRYGCLTINAWLKLVMGVAIPIWGVALMERRAWRQWRGQPANGGAWSLALNACGIAVASGACLLLAEKGAEVWG